MIATCERMIECDPMIGTSSCNVGDFGALYGNCFDDRDICSATSCESTTQRAYDTGRISIKSIGGLPAALAIWQST